MSSTSQIYLPEDQLAEMLTKVKSSRETEELRARLPAQLAPFASNISIIEPISRRGAEGLDEVHCCACSVKERRIRMSVTVVPLPHLQSQDSEEPHAKLLELVWQDWRTTSRYLTGSADSHMHSISIQYDPPHDGMRHSPVTAFTGWYDDPGTSETYFSHGNMKSVVEKVVRDMGFRERELDNKLEVIEALLGDDGRQLLDSHSGSWDETSESLKKIIEDELEDHKDY